MDIMKALEQAIAHEKEAADQYREMARQAEDIETRFILEQIAQEEDKHREALIKRLNTLRLMR